MSMTMDSDTGTNEDSYADIEFINLVLQGEFGDGTNTDEVFRLDPLADELERNQIAELVYYRNDTRSEGGEIEIDVGFNVGNADFLTQAAGNNSSQIEQQSVVKGALYDEAGVLDFYEEGDSGSSVDLHRDKEIDFRDLFHDGPFIDSTDDLSVHIEVDNDSGNPVQASAKFQFGYVIHEVAQGVPRFSDPRSM